MISLWRFWLKVFKPAAVLSRLSSGSEEKLRFAVNTDGSSDEKTTEQTSESSGLKSDKLNSQTK